jgi:hypothetical protein
VCVCVCNFCWAAYVQELLQRLLPPRVGHILARTISNIVHQVDAQQVTFDAHQAMHDGQLAQIMSRLGMGSAACPRKRQSSTAFLSGPPVIETGATAAADASTTECRVESDRFYILDVLIRV